jgi:hypothetical protein
MKRMQKSYVRCNSALAYSILACAPKSEAARVEFHDVEQILSGINALQMQLKTLEFRPTRSDDRGSGADLPVL